MIKLAIRFTVILLLLGSFVVFLKIINNNTKIPINPAYKNQLLSIEARIENLLSQMTLEEKIGQMALVEKNSIKDKKDVYNYKLGGLLSGGGAKPENNTAEGWSEMVNTFDEVSRSTRLGIPILYGVDAIHGHSNIPGATIFPHAIGLGAANDSELVKKIANATAQEVEATGISWIFSPNLDAPEDIRWGRTYEAFSSDHKINARLGFAFIQGLQGITADKVNVLATAKHYLGAGGMRWGSSVNTSYKIDQGATDVNEKVLREFYLQPFKAAVDAGVLSVMAGLNNIDGKKMAANKYLLVDVLKKELGFKGFVVSDWYGVYNISGGEYNATVVAINAGIDMVMLPFDYGIFVKNAKKAVRDGDISEDRINDAVRRILRAKFAVGLFEKKVVGAGGTIGSKEHRDLAREAVTKSLVLLKNKNKVLPLSSDVKRILVAGSTADNTGRQSGGWTIEWQGVNGNVVPGATSILEAIKQTAGPDTVVFGNSDSKFLTSKDLVDVGIAVVGEKPYAEGVGDIEKPMLSQEDLEVISSLRKLCKNLIVVIVSGRPLILPKEMDLWDAIVAAWLPGSEGGGVADVLFGKKPFTGKLPIPWPANLAQLPFSPLGVSVDKTKPLFQIGFGLK